MSDIYGPTIAKRRLARRLTALRTRTGLTANQVCDKLSWGRGKVGRFENNSWKRPELSDIRDLLRAYQVPDDEYQELENLALVARGRQWWREYGDVFGDSEYPGYEADAVRICLFMPLILPGLLQTPSYMRAQMSVGTQPPSWRERAVAARLRRQELFERQDGTVPELVAVITEASLLYHWGSQAERRAQVEHLVEMSRRPNIQLRLVRFVDGLHHGMSSLFTIFDFPGDEPPLAYLENDAELQEVNEPDKVAAYAAIFEQIRNAALDAPATTGHLKHLADTLE
ncbi:helix-turn-helix domain-containing protein [Sphaerimonospora thailandensis]|uniref:helix-turn-helix domain-containing protein n=1 Tax=Sphaerimonospora thailandensis TaxID=795644 RepID=UPI0019526B05|nr:helix-turn-helix transcriptional regulator [Sphaerimonospora thailandensis]